jgi:aspartokinase/homoserine dehydrogenase 1
MQGNKKKWAVHKFGGTSVGSSSCIKKCLDIVQPLIKVHQVAVVVSAMGGKPKVTDLLLQSVHLAAQGDMDGAKAKLDNIRKKHISCVIGLFGGGDDGGDDLGASEMLGAIDKDLASISDLLRAVTLMRFPHEQILELVSGYGEIWSASLIAHAMRARGMDFKFLNAREVLHVSDEEGEASSGVKVEWELSESLLEKRLQKLTEENGGTTPHLLITGYVASTVSGIATTLKRDGSDYSASIFAKMLRAETVTIWTDVSGVYSADPRRVPEAQIIPDVTYSEAIELAYFGAKVIHPKTMAPAIMGDIPIYIRNTFQPTDPGTKIHHPIVLDEGATKKIGNTQAVCGFSSIEDCSLLNIEGGGLVGVPGIVYVFCYTIVVHPFFLSLFVMSVSVSPGRSVAPCLHSLTRHGTSLTTIPIPSHPSINRSSIFT